MDWKKELKEKIDNFVRDVCRIQPNVKSEIRRRLENLLEEAKQKEKSRILKEIKKLEYNSQSENAKYGFNKALEDVEKIINNI